jgi:hypothetical protein
MLVTLDSYALQAIPHEAGHILIAKIVGMPVYGLDHIIIQSPDGRLLPGNFATVGVSPSDEQIYSMDAKLKASYMLYVAGGLAGNIFAGRSADDHGLEKDRADLARVTELTLENVAEKAQSILEKHREFFGRLTSAIKQKYLKLVNDPNVKAGRNSLLSSQELEELLKK